MDKSQMLDLIKLLIADEPAKESPSGDLYQRYIGQTVFIRTVTLYYVGRLKRVQGDCLELEFASWVADTGRFSTALLGGSFNEVERFPDPVLINRGSIIDCTEWRHELPDTK